MATMTNEEILEQIGNKTVVELAELIKGFEAKFGVKAAAVGVAAAAPAAGGAAAPAADKTDFTVMLMGAGDKKIQVIKVVRELTGLGLKEAKDLVEGAPKAVKEGVAKAAAEDMQKKLVEAGGTVELK